MDRDTIKNLLMTTSVVAIIAGTGQEAKAFGLVCETFTGANPAITQTTNVNCIVIDAATVNGDVTIATTATVGGLLTPAPTNTNTELLINNSTISGAVINNGAIDATVADGALSTLNLYGIRVTGGSTVMNGVTNGTTGIIDITVTNTNSTEPDISVGAGIFIDSARFAGNVVNHGNIDVSVFVDPTLHAIANATGMGVQSTSFVGNVINTSNITVNASAIADAGGATALAAAHAHGLLVTATSLSGSTTLSGASAFNVSRSATFIGNVINSGDVQAFATAQATALAGPGATGIAAANGILVGGPTFSGSIVDTGTGTVAASFTEVVTGNLTNNGVLEVGSNAFAHQGSVAGTTNATADAGAFGIHLVGGSFSGSLTSGAGTSIGNIISNTLLANFHSNISNTDEIFANAFAQATAFSSDGSTAFATAVANAAGIDVVGAIIRADILSTSLGGISNTFGGTFVGNISNSGNMLIGGSATGTAFNASSGNVAEAHVTSSAAGIRFVGANLTGNVSALGTGSITNNLSATFLGNITNSSFIGVSSEATGTAITSNGTAATIIHANAAGISVIGGVFDGNVVATALGDINTTGVFSFSGNITNTASGIIRSSATATGLASLNVTGGEYFTTVVAHSSGIQLIGAVFQGSQNSNGTELNETSNAIFIGNIGNLGTIDSRATAVSSLSGSNGAVDSLTRARAAGIEVVGGQSSGFLFGFGSTLSGSITNSGHITAFATAIGRSTILAALGNPFFSAEATADGILAVLGKMTGNVINTGSIGAFSTAVITLANSFGDSEAHAIANGIDVRASTFTGSIGNSAGTIRVFATAFNNDTQVTRSSVFASASANGIYVQNLSSFVGNVGNSGLIVSTADASVTPSGGTALAHAAGISITAGETFQGTVLNSQGGSITGLAIANGGTGAFANATGISVDAFAILGNVTNNGLVQAFASATAVSATTDIASAAAAAIHIGDPGVGLSSFIGNVNNTGVLTAFATATANNTAFASAGGIIVSNVSDGFFTNVSVVSGNIINSGSIGVGAFALSTGTDGSIARALAAGMLIVPSTFIGNISNAGTIFAQAGAAASTSIAGAPIAIAQADGIALIGGTDDTTFLRTVSGSISNSSSGIIDATSTALAGEFGNIVPGGTAFARADGIVVAGDSAGGLVLFGVSTITGSVANQGLIMSTASANGEFLAAAVANGIDILFSTFVGSVSNSGTISATALAAVVDGTVSATAGGINLAGASGPSGSFFALANTFGGNVTNSGYVGATAVADATINGTFANASAFGISLAASTAIGDITNTSTGVIEADAHASVGYQFPPVDFAGASAIAAGILLTASTFAGNLSNAGIINAHALVNAAGTVAEGTARAYGILAEFQTFVGNITNTGFIGAAATSNVLAFGSANAFVDVVGIDMFGFLGVGTIANTGTLVQVSTFVGNVKNAGTIMAIGTAIASSNTATARAIDPATGIRVEVSSFFGDVRNSGQIIAQGTADATGTSAFASALAAGIGINFGIFAGTGSVFPNSVFSGSITNAGTIMANASAHTHGGLGSVGFVQAGATGIRVFSSLVIGNVSNTGFIQATATATNASFDNTGTAFAAGIHIGGIRTNRSANHAFTTFFFGNVTNSGTINAFATSGTNDDVYAAGIQFDVLGALANIDNSKNAVMNVSASVTGSGTALADADGIYVLSSVFAGNVTNEGTIIATATAGPLGTALAFADGIDIVAADFFGNVDNSGVIMAGASALNGSNEAFAGASGIRIGGGEHVGDVTNTGTIVAFATAQSNSGGGGQRVSARGIGIFASSFIGNVNNNGGVILATVSAPTVGSPSSGTATGIGLLNSTFAGNVNNSGTISASSDGTGLGAIGVHIQSVTFIGNLNNSGLIIAQGDATGVLSDPGTFSGAINNTGTIIGIGGGEGRGIRVIGPSIPGGINNSGTVEGDFRSIDMDEETGPGTTINNMSKGLLKGDVRLSATADTLNVFGGSTVMGNIDGNTTGTGPHGIGNADIVNFDLNHDGFGGTLTNGTSVYQFKITNVDTVNLITGTLILDDQDVVGTVTLGPGNIDPVGVFNQTAGSTLGLVVDVGHPKTLGPSTAPTQQTLTITSGIGFVQANTVNISTGATFKAFEEADFYANTNIYPDVVVGLTEMNGNYLNDGTHVLSNSPLFNAFMVENGGGGGPGNDTLVLTRRAFNHPLGVGLTPNENAAGLGLESLYKTGNSTAFAVIPSLFTVDAKDYPLVLKSLDGETILERPDLWQTVLDSLLHRLSQGESFNGQGLAGAMLNHGPVQVASAGFSDADSQVAQTMPMPGPNGVVRPWSAWIRGYGVTGSGPGTINATSFDEKRYGGIGGIDYHVSDNLLVGAFFNYAHGEVDLDPPTPATNKQDAYQFGAYGKYQQGPWYVNAIVGGGFTDNKENRTVLKPFVAPVSGSYNGTSIMAYAEGGWDLYPISNVKLTPLVGVGYNWLHYDGFQETGAPSVLTVHAANTDNLYTSVGARAQTAFNIGTSAPLVPEVRVVWQHEFLDANQEMNANFGGAGLFNVQGSKFSRESVIAGIGISNNVAPDLKVFLDYDAKIQGGYSAHAVSAGLRWSFGGAAPMPPPAAPPPVPAAQPAPPPPSQAQTFVVYFDFDKSDLTPEARSIILQAATVFKQTGAVNLKVDGYTDLAGTAKYNIGLSKRRADVVRAELVRDGVANNAVAEAWHGKDNPAVPTPDGVREPRNRRATIMLP